ncbi:MAG: hypothetical protein MZW92_46460 [Comamonadaceae bacterium]|nr:hypothetical protein [Comamonadaceae bacterium]
MRRLYPGVRDVLVVGDDSETYDAIRRDIGTELAQQPDIRAHFVSAGYIDQLVDALRAHSERIVFLTTLGAVGDRNGRTLRFAETHRGHRAAPASSSCSAWRMPTCIQACSGGYVTSGQRQGEVAADLLARHLAGTPVRELPPVASSPNEYILDATELQRAGLTLPDDIARIATLINPVPTFYDRNLTVIVNSAVCPGRAVRGTAVGLAAGRAPQEPRDCTHHRGPALPDRAHGRSAGDPHPRPAHRRHGQLGLAHHREQAVLVG